MTLKEDELKALCPFWYPVLPFERLGPEPFALELLGQQLVLWLQPDGSVAVAEDRCCHRSARLSGGWIKEQGELVCPYHGWEFGVNGHCLLVPQEPGRVIPANYKIKTHLTQVRYSYIWVCLGDEPITPIPDFPEVDDPCTRQIKGFFESWICSPFRVIENGLDNYHHYFVHRGLLDATTPIPEPLQDQIKETNDGFSFSIPLEVSNNATLSETINSQNNRVIVQRQVCWITPLGLSLKLDWPNGISQRIVLYAFPLDCKNTRIVRFYFRNDTDEMVPEVDVIKFERGLINQDRQILEGIDKIYGATPSHECLIEADRPIAMMRLRLLQLLGKTLTN